MQSVSHASDTTATTAFMDSLAREFSIEYRICTGDSSPMDVRRLIAWRRQISTVTASPDYQTLLKAYCLSTGAQQNTVTPCAVWDWKAQNDKENELIESKNAQIYKQQQIEAQDSALVAKALADNSPSTFDLLSIPFGIPKIALMMLLKKYSGIPFFDSGNFLFVKQFAIADRTFLAAFFFDRSGRLYKYEIESDPASADQINRIVRPDAEFLTTWFEQKCQRTLERIPVGFFDITEGRLATTAQWNDTLHRVEIGMSSSKNKYYAKTVVVDIQREKIMKTAPPGRPY